MRDRSGIANDEYFGAVDKSQSVRDGDPPRTVAFDPKPRRDGRRFDAGGPNGCRGRQTRSVDHDAIGIDISHAGIKPDLNA